MAIAKYVKKVARKVRGQAIKRYFKKKSNYSPKMTRIMKDVNYLKSVLNPEKKIWQISQTDVLVGQCNINNNAYSAFDITPKPSQGITDSTRNGNSIKVHSGHFRFQMQAENQSSGHPINFKFVVVKVVGTPIAAANIVPDMYKSNPFITNGTIYDYHSDRREDTFKKYVVLRTKTLKIQPNSHTGQVMHANISFGIRYKSHHVKYSSNAATEPSDGQLYMLVFADVGNINGTASTLTGTSITGGSTGARLCGELTQWFYDN